MGKSSFGTHFGWQRLRGSFKMTSEAAQFLRSFSSSLDRFLGVPEHPAPSSCHTCKVGMAHAAFTAALDG